MNLLLSRTCKLADFPECLSVAEWQQSLADVAWQTWETHEHARTRRPSLCLNWSGCPFIAPGAGAIYQYRDQPPNGVTTFHLPAVYGLCVLDHVEAPVRFLLNATQILRPRGLLFLTFTFWDAEGPDCALGADRRTRIYDVTALKKLIGESRRLGFHPFGGVDWEYHGNTLADHTLASLVLQYRGRPDDD